jgi:hypothetical protein
MRKFLGMPLMRKALTDAECVERARKDVDRWRRYGKWLALFQVAVAIGYVCIFALVVKVVQQLGGGQGGQPGNFFMEGLCLGIMFGMVFGIPFLNALHQLANTMGSLQGIRALALLVKYHDLLCQLAKLEEEPSPVDGAGQGEEPKC